MEMRNEAVILQPVIAGVLASLKGLPLTGEYEEDIDGVTMQCAEFPDEYENAPTLEEARMKLVKGLKGWAESFTDNFEEMTRGREKEVPYLLKILISTEEELLSCLRSSRHESI